MDWDQFNEKLFRKRVGESNFYSWRSYIWYSYVCIVPTIC